MPTLLFYSMRDRLVSKEEVIKFYKVCRVNKGLIEIREGHE